MTRFLLLVLLAGRATTEPCPSPRIDWSALDYDLAAARRKYEAAAWKADHRAADLTRDQCESLWQMHEAAMRAMRTELDAIVRRNRECFELAMDGRTSGALRAALLVDCAAVPR